MDRSSELSKSQKMQYKDLMNDIKNAKNDFNTMCQTY